VEQERRPRGRDDEGGEDEGEERGGRGMMRRVRVCQFCAEKTKRIDYKSVDVLRGLISDRGKIRPRRQTGTCARHQREVAEAIKRARHMALLPFAGEMPR
jgi:small subunit ribosomal protein S18